METQKRIMCEHKRQMKLDTQHCIFAELVSKTALYIDVLLIRYKSRDGDTRAQESKRENLKGGNSSQVSWYLV